MTRRKLRREAWSKETRGKLEKEETLTLAWRVSTHREAREEAGRVARRERRSEVAHKLPIPNSFNE